MVNKGKIAYYDNKIRVAKLQLNRLEREKPSTLEELRKWNQDRSLLLNHIEVLKAMKDPRLVNDLPSYTLVTI